MIEQNTIILLHGALGSKEQMLPFRMRLESEYAVHDLDFSGHGAKASDDVVFSPELFTNNVLSYMDEHSLKKACIFGYSLGGYVGLTLAQQHPDRVLKVMTLGTKLYWTPSDAQKEASFLDLEMLRKKYPEFVNQQLKTHGADHVETVFNKTKDMMLMLGQNDLLDDQTLHNIQVPVCLGVGDRDQTAGLENTIRAYRQLQHGQLIVIPQTPHPIERGDHDLIAAAIWKFVAQ